MLAYVQSPSSIQLILCAILLIRINHGVEKRGPSVVGNVSANHARRLGSYPTADIGVDGCEVA